MKMLCQIDVELHGDPTETNLRLWLTDLVMVYAMAYVNYNNATSFHSYPLILMVNALGWNDLQTAVH